MSVTQFDSAIIFNLLPHLRVRNSNLTHCVPLTCSGCLHTALHSYRRHMNWFRDLLNQRHNIEVIFVLMSSPDCFLGKWQPACWTDIWIILGCGSGIGSVGCCQRWEISIKILVVRVQIPCSIWCYQLQCLQIWLTSACLSVRPLVRSSVYTWQIIPPNDFLSIAWFDKMLPRHCKLTISLSRFMFFLFFFFCFFSFDNSSGVCHI